MSHPDPTSAEPLPQPAEPWSPTHLLSWLAIAFVAGLIMFQNGVFDSAAPASRTVHAVNPELSPQTAILLRFANIAGEDGTPQPEPAEAEEPAAAPAADQGDQPKTAADDAKATGDADESVPFAFNPAGGPPKVTVAQQLSAMIGSVDDLLKSVEPGGELGCAVILARLNRLEDAQRAVAQLEERIAAGKAENNPEMAGLIAEVKLALNAIQQGSTGPSALTPDQEVLLKFYLGAAGDSLVAMATNNLTRQKELAEAGVLAAVCLGIVCCGGIAVALIGFCVLVTMAILAFQEKLVGVAPPQAPARSYAAVFAVWLGSFYLLHKVPALVMWGDTTSEMALTISIVGSVISCAIGVWAARMFGITWAQFCADTGLRRPRFSDLGWGLVCYSMALALLSVALIAVMILIALTGGGGIKASHPIQQIVSSSGAVGLVLSYVVASVCAPLFEELFFRGALYQNLRATWGPWVGSVGAAAVAMLTSSVLFAAIHPQGLIFVPVLGALAVAFCLMREWRGTINPGIWAHAINNGIMITLNVLLLR